MQTFIWNQRFETGIAAVDEQHLRLVELINSMAKLVTEGKDDDAAIDAILGELGEYASYHFDEEESLMEESGIDRRHFEHHQLQHSQFIDQVGQMWDSRDKQGKPEGKPAAAIGEYLSSWLSSHILEEDQAMALQLALIAAGVAPEAAYQKEQSGR
jgi:hemerythrin-like metal-binding protein